MIPPPLHDIGAHRRLLVDFAAGFRTGPSEHDANVDLKLDHSLRVMDEAEAILDTLDLAPDDRATCLLAALYHDVGRFEQLRRFNTFDDSKSVNHGALGCRILGREPFLDALEPARRRVARAAVAVHNRRRLPRGLEPGVVMAARLVRDADKLDIYRVMIEHLSSDEEFKPVVTLGVRPHPERYTPQLLDAVLEGRQGDYRRMAWTNDFKLLLLSWVHSMHFSAARRALAERGLVRAVLDTLPDAPEFRELARRLDQALDGGLGTPGL